MATAFVAGAGSKDDTSDTSIAVTVAGVGAGNLIVLLVKWEGATTTVTVSDGTSSLTQDSLGVLAHSNNDLNGCMFYLLSSVATGSVTYTATLGAARPFKQMAAGAFSYSGTAARNAGVQTAGTGTAVDSGAFSPSGSDLVAIGYWGNYVTETPTNHLINGVADDGIFGNTDGTQGWYRLLTSGFTSGQASVTQSINLAFLGFGAAFAITAGGGGETVTWVGYIG